MNAPIKQQSPVLKEALRYARIGWMVFPVPPGEKKSHKSAEHSGGVKWGMTSDALQIVRDWKQWPQANVGIPTGWVNRLFVVETDTKEGHDVDGAASLKQFEEQHGALPETRMAVSPSGSVHRYFKHPGSAHHVKTASNVLGPGVDVRGDGGMVVAPPSVRTDGCYRWLNELPIADAPKWLLDIVIIDPTEIPADTVFEMDGPPLKRKPDRDPADIDGIALDNCEKWVTALFPTAKLSRGWWRIARKDLPERIDEATGQLLTEDLSIGPGGIKDFGQHDTNERDGRKGKRQPHELVMMYYENGASGFDSYAAKCWLCDRMGLPRPTGAPRFSEEALALAFADRHAGDLRYVAKWGRWYYWNGQRWQEDTTRKVFDLARYLCREVAQRANKAAKGIASAKTRAAVVSLASEDRRLAATIEQWDADPWLLCTPGGTVDLRTGQLRPSEPEDYMTMMAAVAPGGECPLWHKVLKRVTNNNASLIKFLQVACGYGLTGSIREHILLFLHGTGRNGKGVFVETVGGLMGDYRIETPVSTLIDSDIEQHPTDLARMRGARLVTASETEQGLRWSESKLKNLTGGSPITARFMRQDSFTFDPQFLLMVAGNHKPGLKTVDIAIKSRIKLVPFTVFIPEEERDKELPNKLKEEWPGILQWLIDGCVEWQRDGLTTPDSVTKASSNYFATEDAIARWIDECCVMDAQENTPQSVLFGSWVKWAAERKEFVGSSKRFTQMLEDRGYEYNRDAGVRRNLSGFHGLRLADDRDPPF